jgi:hypothetical protein
MITDIVFSGVNAISELACLDSKEVVPALDRLILFYTSVANELNEKKKLGHKIQFDRKMIGGGEELMVIPRNPRRQDFNLTQAHALAEKAAQEGDLATAFLLASQVDAINKRQSNLERALPISNPLIWALSTLPVGALLGIAVFYILVVAPLTIVPGLTATTAQYTANLAVNATRATASTITLGYVNKEAPQPDPVEVGRTVANGLQEAIQSAITDRVAQAYMFISSVAFFVIVYAAVHVKNYYTIRLRQITQLNINTSRKSLRNNLVKTLKNRQNRQALFQSVLNRKPTRKPTLKQLGNTNKSDSE